ncbi:hypothetical protein NDU88_001363 [Pleurodeles waltl]|uniref:Uncharacterized protein n=1 Tax=Pleurodeles waltl TaxID=8319 RepID=A0AAV7W197_PLEWA|nr:hypothetical protein NDU88_001363 [Pleurodeles waltl]
MIPPLAVFRIFQFPLNIRDLLPLCRRLRCCRPNFSLQLLRARDPARLRHHLDVPRANCYRQKTAGSRSVGRRKSAALGRAPRSILLAPPSGACPRGHDPWGSCQKTVKHLQRSVLQAHGIRGIRGFRSE